MTFDGCGTMNVLVITPWYPDSLNPSSGAFVREHVRSVAPWVRVAVVHLQGIRRTGGRLWQINVEGDTGLTAGIPTIRVSHLRPVPGSGLLGWVLSCWKAVRKFVSDGFRPDLLHAHVFTAGFAAVTVGMATRMPVVVTEHFTIFQRQLLTGQQRLLARWTFGRAARVICVSRALQTAIQSYGISGRFTVIPNCVDTGIFRPREPNVRKHQQICLLTVGGLDKDHKKGIPYLLRALAEVRAHGINCTLDIVGDGEMRGEYENLAKTLGLRSKVRFHGCLPHDQVAYHMRSADIYVVASLHETFSVTAIEALACGLPVLATKCGGPEQYITEEVGCVVEAGSAASLAQGIITMVDRLPDMQPGAISKFAHERFSHDVVGRQIVNVYREVLVSGNSTNAAV